MHAVMHVARSSGVTHVWARCAARAPAAVAVMIAAGAGCIPTSQYRAPHAAAPAEPAGPGVAATAASTAAALVGDWTGQYDAPIYARRGAMRVSLRRVARTVGGVGISTVAGTATFAAGAAANDSAVVDSARVTPGRVVLWFQPMAEQASGATLQVRLDGALAGDTLGGRLRADAAATATSERHGGWRLIRVAPRTTASRAP